MQKEIWKKINGYENYDVSNFGNVRNNNFHRQKATKEIKKDIKPNGYIRVILSKDSKTKSFYVHRLVAESFIENKENKQYVNHKDGNRSNNCVENLEWVTASENLLYTYRVLGYKKTNKSIEKAKETRNRNYKMSEETKRKIGVKNSELLGKKVLCIELGTVFQSASKASQWLGLTKKVVCRACRNNKTSGGYHWKYLER